MYTYYNYICQIVCSVLSCFLKSEGHMMFSAELPPTNSNGCAFAAADSAERKRLHNQHHRPSGRFSWGILGGGDKRKVQARSPFFVSIHLELDSKQNQWPPCELKMFCRICLLHLDICPTFMQIYLLVRIAGIHRFVSLGGVMACWTLMQVVPTTTLCACFLFVPDCSHVGDPGQFFWQARAVTSRHSEQGALTGSRLAL